METRWFVDLLVDRVLLVWRFLGCFINRETRLEESFREFVLSCFVNGFGWMLYIYFSTAQLRNVCSSLNPIMVGVSWMVVRLKLEITLRHITDTSLYLIQSISAISF